MASWAGVASAEERRRELAAADRETVDAYRVGQEVNRLEYLLARLEVLLAQWEDLLQERLATPSAPQSVEEPESEAQASG